MKKNGKENLTSNNGQEYQEKALENAVENTTRFKNTKDLQEFSSTTTLPSGEEMTVTGLDMIFSDALEDKLSKIKSGQGGTAYSHVLTAVGPSEIKAFIIDENVIGGYIIYYHYDSASGSAMEGYYLHDKELAIKVTNWEGLNNLRNKRI